MISRQKCKSQKQKRKRKRKVVLGKPIKTAFLKLIANFPNCKKYGDRFVRILPQTSNTSRRDNDYWIDKCLIDFDQKLTKGTHSPLMQLVVGGHPVKLSHLITSHWPVAGEHDWPLGH